jgi:hypothetical protein
MNFKYFLILIPLFLCAEAFSQQNYISISPQMIRKSTIKYDGVSTYYYRNNNMTVIKGSPFLINQFEPGVIVTHEDTIRDIPIRYNIFNRNMDILFNKDTLVITDVSKIKSISLGGRDFIYTSFRHDNGPIEYGYLEQLTKEKFELFVHYVKNVKHDEYVSNYMGGGGSKDDFFEDKHEFYLKTDQDIPKQIAPKKAELCKLFPDYSDRISKYIKENHLKLSNMDDFRNVIQYLAKETESQQN